LDVVEGTANFLMAHLPEDGPTSAEVVRRCRSQQVYLRDLTELSRRLGSRAIRVAVKDAATQRRILEVLADAVERGEHPRRRAVVRARANPAPPTP
jgi:histidinol-phosphate/aromatic aminotransferase/cobyric acid decarboxylase-like protein